VRTDTLEQVYSLEDEDNWELIYREQ